VPHGLGGSGEQAGNGPLQQHLLQRRIGVPRDHHSRLDEEITARADLFSLAAVAYQALTGQKPFQGATVTTVIYRVVHEDPPPPRQWNQGLPAHYDDVFRKALSKTPAGRYPTAQAFTAALELRAFELDSDQVVAVVYGGTGR
jgi:serine/threonine protein kinase